jgi:large subunit ribosomal protein L10
MNKEQKTAVVEEVASQIQDAEAVFAVDYRGISVPQAAELRAKLTEAGARFRVVKNTLTLLAADKAGAEDLKELLEGPTAFTFVPEDGDPALAAKALATFRREHDVLDFKGGRMAGEVLSVDELQALARLPAREVLNAQVVGMVASPITGLVRGLNQLIAGLASQLQQIADQGLVGGEAPPAEEEAPAEEEGEAAEEPAEAEESTGEAEAPGAEEEEPPVEPHPDEPSGGEQAAPGGDEGPEGGGQEPDEGEQAETETETPSENGEEEKED